MGLFSTKDRHEFKPLLVELEDSPVSPLARWLLWVMVVFMILASLWLYFAQIDVVVSARGKVIPDGEIKVVQPIETGVISKILVREGDLVKHGEILMEIDPSVTESSLATKEEHLFQLRIEILRLNALIDETHLELPQDADNTVIIATQQHLYRTMKSEYTEQTQLITEQLHQAEDQLQAAKIDRQRTTKLLKSATAKKTRLEQVLDIIAHNEYEKVREEVINYEEQAGMKTHEISQAKAKIAELHNQKNLYARQFKNRLLETLSQKRIEASQLKAEVESIAFKKSKQYITSPVDGHIGKLYVHTVGGVVTPAEKLMSIIPADTPLVLKVTVLNQDIGFIVKDMEVAIKVDTFTYQKYGLIDGKVLHISDDAIEDEKLGPVYEVFVQPLATYLEHNGKQYELHTGMSVNAEMKVGKRRVIEFFIYPAIRYLDEGISVR